MNNRMWNYFEMIPTGEATSVRVQMFTYNKSSNAAAVDQSDRILRGHGHVLQVACV